MPRRRPLRPPLRSLPSPQAARIFFAAASQSPRPLAETLTGKSLLPLLLFAPRSERYFRPNSVWGNLAQASSARQLRGLQLLLQHLKLSPELRRLPLPECIHQFVLNKANAARQRWKPQTFLRELATMHGALKFLPKYSPNTQCSIDLSLSSNWRALMAAWQKQAIQHAPVDQAAAAAEDISKALALTADIQVRMFLLLLWLSCARKGDIGHLTASSVTFKTGASYSTGHLELFIHQGKGVAANKAKYRIQTMCPPAFEKELRQFLQSRLQEVGRDSPLFRSSLSSSNEIVALLKRVHEKLDCRSLRRGSLQTIAQDPNVTEETLMRLSGHRNVKTLHRYLGWSANVKGNRESAAAAQSLHRGL